MSHSYVNGFSGSITFGTTSLDVESWDLTVTCEALDTTNTGDGGWESNINGAKAWEGNIKTFWDSANNQFASPLAMVAGASGTITLPLGASGKAHTGTVRITSVSNENPTKGVVTFNAAFKGNGALTYAT